MTSSPMTTARERCRCAVRARPWRAPARGLGCAVSGYRSAVSLRRPDRLDSSRTGQLLIAHRACPNHAPENTLAGVRVAMASGIDAVEVDVRLSADGVPVVIHDAHLVRIAHRFRRVRSLAARELAQVEVLGSDETIPTLASVLACANGFPVAIDIKDPAATLPTLALLANLDPAQRTLVWSASRAAIEETAAAQQPGVEVALLSGVRHPRQVARLLTNARDWGAAAVSVDQAIVTSAFVRRARARNLGVYTLVKARSADRLAATLRLGVAGVITDWPDLSVTANGATGTY